MIWAKTEHFAFAALQLSALLPSGVYGAASCLGCFQDISGQGYQRVLSDWIDFSDTSHNTLEKCQGHCRSKGYSYAGNHGGQNCFCGNCMYSSSDYGASGSLGSQVSRGKCSRWCAGDPTGTCGGVKYVQVSYTSDYGCYDYDKRAVPSDVLTMSMSNYGPSDGIQACKDYCASNYYVYVGVRTNNNRYGTPNECNCFNTVQFNPRNDTSQCVGRSDQIYVTYTQFNKKSGCSSSGYNPPPQPYNPPMPTIAPKPSTALPSATSNPVPIPSNRCTTNTVRKSWDDMTTTQRQNFLKALKKFNSATSVLPGNKYTYADFVSIHSRNMNSIHGTSLFLPFHRYFIRLFEQHLQAIDATVFLPYWDWSRASIYQDPQSGLVFSSSALGSVTALLNSNTGYCLNIGDGSGSTYQLSNSGDSNCVQRLGGTDSSGFYTGRIGGPLTAPNVIDSYTTSASLDSFNTYAKVIEYIHGDVHVKCGGDMSHLNTSPKDPLFFFHHANVDRFWSNWQSYDNYRRQFAYASSTSDKLVEFTTVTVASVLDHQNSLCYSYQPPASGFEAQSEPAQTQEALPEEWHSMIFSSPEEANDILSTIASITQSVNDDLAANGN